MALAIVRLWRTKGVIRIDGKQSLITHLVESNILDESSVLVNNGLACQVVFNLIGWVSMLYDPKLDVSNTSQLAILLGGAQSPLEREQPIHSARRPLVELLCGFGSFLPHNPNAFSLGVKPGNVETDDTIASANLNADILRRNGVSIRWVLSVSAHLDFDSENWALSLFCLPSFCRLHQGGDTTFEWFDTNAFSQRDAWLTTLKSFWRTLYNEQSQSAPTPMAKLMSEIIRSYKLLFRESKSARRIFRKFEQRRAQEALPAGCSLDPLLAQLCGAKDLKSSRQADPDRLRYSRSVHFPLLAARISVLQDVLAKQKPGGLLSVWHDRRDFDALYTFRAVIIFGTIGVILSLIQTVLTGVQVYYAAQDA